MGAPSPIHGTSLQAYLTADCDSNHLANDETRRAADLSASGSSGTERLY